MNIFIFEYKNFGTEDIKECFEKNGHKYVVVETNLYRDRISPEFDKIFDDKFGQGVDNEPFDCVFTFNFSPVISNNCKKRNVPYIAFVYDSPQVLLYSYTIINPCNYVFIFDKTQYTELKMAGINTVYYAPLAVNADRMKRMLDKTGCSHNNDRFKGDIAFVGSMYNEKYNLFDRLEGINDFTKGYLDAIMKAQRKVYGYFFLEQLLSGEVLKDMIKNYPVEPSKDGVETVSYLYADYFLARKMASDERMDIMKLLGKELGEQHRINLYTPNPTPGLAGVNNCGPIDYYDDMPYVFRNSKINLNITLRSIKSGIPLRGMDIMGAGGFLMSNYQEDFFDFFVPGEDMVLYESEEDLICKCRYYLDHDDEREAIARSGSEKIAEHHTYDVRFNEIFNIVFN